MIIDGSPATAQFALLYASITETTIPIKVIAAAIIVAKVLIRLVKILVRSTKSRNFSISSIYYSFLNFIFNEKDFDWMMAHHLRPVNAK